MLDQIDELAGIEAGDPIDALRRSRSLRREQLQALHVALFSPVEDTEFSPTERALVAAFATRLTAPDKTAKAYAIAAISLDPTGTAAVVAEAEDVATSGPYGNYVEKDLVAKGTDGPRYVPSEAFTEVVGKRLAAAFEYAHLLTYRPRESDANAIDRLLEAGWDTIGIVTLTEFIAALALQQRVVAGLRVLKTTMSDEVAK